MPLACRIPPCPTCAKAAGLSTRGEARKSGAPPPAIAPKPWHIEQSFPRVERPSQAKAGDVARIDLAQRTVVLLAEATAIGGPIDAIGFIGQGSVVDWRR